MAEIEKLHLTSLDIPQTQLEKLKELFPEVFTEGNKLDFDRLRANLGDAVDDGPERFGLTWPGKRDCFRLTQEPSTGTLLLIPDESVSWDTTQRWMPGSYWLMNLKRRGRTFKFPGHPYPYPCSYPCRKVFGSWPDVVYHSS